MLRCQKTKFWLENPINLLCSCDIIPLDDMILSEQMNAITRLIFLVFIILILFNFDSSFLFLLLSLVLIIILYYIQRTQMNQSKKENFQCNTMGIPCGDQNFLTAPVRTEAVLQYAENVYNPKPGLAQNLIGTPSSCYNCNIESPLDAPIEPYNGGSCDKIDERGVYNNPHYISNNQKLAGFANPKTLIEPVMVQKSHDLDSWRTNNSVVHSAINDLTQVELYQSGQQVTTCCPPYIEGLAIPTENPNRKTVPLKLFDETALGGEIPPPVTSIIEPTGSPTPLPLPSPPSASPISNDVQPDNNLEESYRKPKIERWNLKKVVENYNNKHTNNNKPVVEKYIGPITTTEISKAPPQGRGESPDEGLSGGEYNYRYPFLITTALPLKQDVILPDEYGGAIDTASGYNAKQLLEAGIPSNLPAGIANQDPRMKSWNSNLFKQTVQPGVYTSNQIIEPINDLIGVGFTQQFEPLLDKMDPVTGKVSYTNLDPRIINPDLYTEKLPEMDMNATEANVYDPRYSGYGTSYRAYTDENLGQTKFYYDDIDAIRMPNYIVRSEIDTRPFADTYGPIPKGDEMGNKSNAIIRGLAQDAFLQASLEHRNDLMEKQMRKANARAWQQKAMPITTSGQYSLGSMSLTARG